MTMEMGASHGGATMMRPTLIARRLSCERAAQFSSAASNLVPNDINNEFDVFLAHCAEAAWRPVIDSVFTLAEAHAAHRRLDAPDRFGKIVLAIDESRL